MKKIFILIGFILLLGIVFVFSQTLGKIKKDDPQNESQSLEKIIRLTFDAKENKTRSYIYPRWSPNGEKIAFTSNMGFGYAGFEGIWVMDVDGANKKKLVDKPSDFIWGSDSNRVLFFLNDILYEAKVGTGEIHQVDTPGKKVTGLTIQPSGRIIGFMEDTLVRIGINKATGKTEVYKIDASTGQQNIVYVQPPEIWTANADGSNKKMLIKNGSDPLPSSDGQYLIYRNLQTGHSVVIEIEKNKEIWLGALSFDASWHPDSRRIIYSEVRIEEQAKGGYGIESVTGEIMDADLYIMDVLSGDSKPLTNTKDEVELYPNCSPDGSKIVYVSGITGDIYLINILEGGE